MNSEDTVYVQMTSIPAQEESQRNQSIPFNYQAEDTIPIGISTPDVNLPRIQRNVARIRSAPQQDGPSTSSSLLLANDHYESQASHLERDPVVVEQVRKGIYQAQFINCFLLWLSSIKLLLVLLAVAVSSWELSPSMIYIVMLLIYDSLYFSHNLSLIVMLPRTPFHAFFIYYDTTDPQNQDTNISGLIISQCWQMSQPINGLTIMDSCERYFKAIYHLAEFLRIYYMVIFIYGNIIFLTGIYLYEPNFIYQPLLIANVLLGYVYLSIPLILCCTWPCLLAVLHCIPFANNRIAARPAKKSIINSIAKKKYTKVQDNLLSDFCTICYLEYKKDESEIIQLPCNEGHYFHAECCKKWLQINGTCPICRESVEKAFHEKNRRL